MTLLAEMVAWTGKVQPVGAAQVKVEVVITSISVPLVRLPTKIPFTVSV